ncbi:efflux RND transporter periplasmic adaptor subunit [Oceanospirillum sediminis]|uniref:Efflux RND transporter periplasmic adaptor subunit n=1 Tax=Oceanospirillum sediminis TaxID=2760088 RepID=A0A839IRD6_9GAMM|nr:efflux RND transporter periplasmic adaptor subunit [Oceanospirillum sediminis]MBB1486776.1 efflux RND transporter periplasmic adaptor subunit [Oceanospirillum sediminis]
MFKKIQPVIVLASMVALAWYIMQNPPEKGQFRPPEPVGIKVQSLTLHRQNYQVTFDRLARVQAQTSTQLIARVSGEVLYINPLFRSGGRVKKDDLLLRLDQTDLKNDLLIARAALTEAVQALDEEKARVEDAAQAWRLSGRKDSPSDRVLRKPQLIAAKARVKSEQVKVQKVENDLERTYIRAPFDAIVLNQAINIGQPVSQGNVLGELRAELGYELRIALNERELPFVDLPVNGDKGAEFTLAYEQGGMEMTDQKNTGYLTRTEDALDTETLQLITIGHVEFDEDDNLKYQMRPGRYIRVRIKGRVLDQVLVVPNTSIYQGSYVYLAENQKLKRQKISVLWRDDDVSIIQQGLQEGDELITTPLGQVVSGTRVQTDKSLTSDEVNKNQRDTQTAAEVSQ